MKLLVEQYKSLQGEVTQVALLVSDLTYKLIS